MQPPVREPELLDGIAKALHTAYQWLDCSVPRDKQNETDAKLRCLAAATACLAEATDLLLRQQPENCGRADSSPSPTSRMSMLSTLKSWRAAIFIPRHFAPAGTANGLSLSVFDLLCHLLEKAAEYLVTSAASSSEQNSTNIGLVWKTTCSILHMLWLFRQVDLVLARVTIDSSNQNYKLRVLTVWSLVDKALDSAPDQTASLVSFYGMSCLQDWLNVAGTVPIHRGVCTNEQLGGESKFMKQMSWRTLGRCIRGTWLLSRGLGSKTLRLEAHASNHLHGPEAETTAIFSARCARAAALHARIVLCDTRVSQQGREGDTTAFHAIVHGITAWTECLRQMEADLRVSAVEAPESFRPIQRLRFQIEELCTYLVF